MQEKQRSRANLKAKSPQTSLATTPTLIENEALASAACAVSEQWNLPPQHAATDNYLNSYCVIHTVPASYTPDITPNSKVVR
jgi:hypothetical protein